MTTTSERNSLRAFHGDEAIKATYLARIRAHREADEIVKGIYYEQARGSRKGQMCAVGCTIHGDNHYAYETELGIPAELAFLEDQIFESTDGVFAKAWPERFLEVIPVGADLSGIWANMVAWLLVDPTDGVIALAKTDEVRAWIRAVAVPFEREAAGEVPTGADLDGAAAAAREAREAREAWEAWEAWAASAAWAAREAREAWAARAAWEAWAARAAWEAWAAWDVKTRERARLTGERLLSLLSAAPIREGVAP